MKGHFQKGTGYNNPGVVVNHNSNEGGAAQGVTLIQLNVGIELVDDDEAVLVTVFLDEGGTSHAPVDMPRPHRGGGSETSRSSILDREGFDGVESMKSDLHLLSLDLMHTVP